MQTHSTGWVRVQTILRNDSLRNVMELLQETCAWAGHISTRNEWAKKGWSG
jgi:hypothetical protein